MRNGRASWTAVLLLALATPAAGQERETTPREEYEQARGEPKRAPVIPRALREIITESRPERLIVRGLSGQSIPVSLEWFEPSDFTTYYDGRYVGFRYIGYEEEGYVVVDRQMSGAAATLATGQAPNFSPDGRWFAAAEATDSGFGNLNGVALFEILPDRTVRRFFTDVLPQSFDWRVDRWVRPDCVAISAVETNYEIPQTDNYEEAVRNAPRFNYALEVGDGLAFSPTYSEPPCVPQASP